jgi:hypothetical protein
LASRPCRPAGFRAACRHRAGGTWACRRWPPRRTCRPGQRRGRTCPDCGQAVPVVLGDESIGLTKMQRNRLHASCRAVPAHFVIACPACGKAAFSNSPPFTSRWLTSPQTRISSPWAGRPAAAGLR